MNSGLRAGRPPTRPVLVYDGDCRFCTLWIRRGQQLTGEAVEYLPAQDPRVADQFPEIPRAWFDTAIQLIDTDGRVYSGAEAVCRTLAHHRGWRWALEVYEDHPLVARVADRGYRFVAEHRPVFSMLTRWGWGRHVEAPSYFLTRWLFLRALGLVWLVAFLSLGTQVNGLIGHDGILPADQYMAAIKQSCDAHGIGLDRYHLVPTLCWWGTSNVFLDGQCVAGIVLAGLVILGIAPAPCLFLLWVVYLSLVTVGRDFYGFQWDNLLLETGWLAIFLAPLQLLPRPLGGLRGGIGCQDANEPEKLVPVGGDTSALTPAFSPEERENDRPAHHDINVPGWPTPGQGTRPTSRCALVGWFKKLGFSWGESAPEAAPSRLFVWLLRLLLFKLMLLSGCVKLLSHDPTWRNLTALTYHYQTQPLPPWTAWYAQQLPVWFQKFSCATLFAIELGAPWLMFGPRRVRLAGAGLLAGLQVLIVLTGNYAYFNWLTLALCLVLLDDFMLAGLVPVRLRGWFGVKGEGGVAKTQDGKLILGQSQNMPESEAFSTCCGSQTRAPGAWRWPQGVVVGVAAVVLGSSGFVLAETLGFRSALLAPLGWVTGELEPFRTVSSYGLFAVMTTQRNEIVMEGSNDGVTWRPYEFKYKPGDVNRRPGFVAPMQPRLDWQMWFAALGSPEQSPWLDPLCVRLLQGSPDVLALLAGNPFPEAPPKYIRAELYNYQFTDAPEWRATGAWWRRTRVGEFLPAVSLRE